MSPTVSLTSLGGAFLPHAPHVSILITLDEIYDVFAIFRASVLLSALVSQIITFRLF
jgi:hypothetical protein